MTIYNRKRFPSFLTIIDNPTKFVLFTRIIRESFFHFFFFSRKTMSPLEQLRSLKNITPRLTSQPHFNSTLPSTVINLSSLTGCDRRKKGEKKGKGKKRKREKKGKKIKREKEGGRDILATKAIEKAKEEKPSARLIIVFAFSIGLGTIRPWRFRLSTIVTVFDMWRNNFAIATRTCVCIMPASRNVSERFPIYFSVYK